LVAHILIRSSNVAEKTNGTSAPKKAAAGRINKMEAVRRAMKKLGIDAGRQEIHDEVKKEFGIDMSLDHISTYRGEIRRKATAKPAGAAVTNMTKPAAPKPAAPKPAAPKPATALKAAAPKPAALKAAAPATPAAGNGETPHGISLTDIQLAKDLLGRIGVDELKTLLDLLVK
jgi:uncharacterized membrane protein